MNIIRNSVIMGEKSNRNRVNVSINDGNHCLKNTDINDTIIYENIDPKKTNVIVVNSTNKHRNKVFFNSNNSFSNVWIRRYKFDKCFSICCSSNWVLSLFVLSDELIEALIRFCSSSGVTIGVFKQLFRICVAKFPRVTVCLQTLHWT